MPITLIGSRGRRTTRQSPDREPRPPAAEAPRERFRLLTLNVAHARRHGRHQALLTPPTLRRNLAAIAAVLRREEPDVVALQEADGPSAWSGSFDHVATLAELTGLSHTLRGEHNPFSLGRLDFSSGTALISRLPLAEPRSHAFSQNWRDTKGFVAATVAPVALAGTAVDVVSVHLDFLAERVRRRQIEQLVERFRARVRPLVLMGDFNCEWSDQRLSFERLRRELALRPPDTVAHATYPAWRPLMRLDWILISEELGFATYETLPDRLSDHLGVIADVGFREEAKDSAAEPERLPLFRRSRKRVVGSLG